MAFFDVTFNADGGKIASGTDPALSNSLTDLAARIRVEHEAVNGHMQQSLEHAIATGQLLLEAKGQVGKHGRWLPWLDEHCRIPQRTAQHYMRLARRRDKRKLCGFDCRRSGQVARRRTRACRHPA